MGDRQGSSIGGRRYCSLGMTSVERIAVRLWEIRSQTSQVYIVKHRPTLREVVLHHGFDILSGGLNFLGAFQRFPSFSFVQRSQPVVVCLSA